MTTLSFQHTEGIILRVIPFQDYDQILTVFTAESGVIKLLYKGSRRKRQRGQTVCLPLTKVEVIYQEKSSEIFNCQEMTAIQSFTVLRKSLLFLEVACDLIQTISSSQLVGKPAPKLYELLNFYLLKIPYASYPWNLSSSFKLKLLRHDGLIHFPFKCSQCFCVLEKKAYVYDLEAWCEEHHQKREVLWQEQELKYLYCLALSQSYKEICGLNLAAHLHIKIKNLFEIYLKKY